MTWDHLALEIFFISFNETDTLSPIGKLICSLSARAAQRVCSDSFLTSSSQLMNLHHHHAGAGHLYCTNFIQFVIILDKFEWKASAGLKNDGNRRAITHEGESCPDVVCARFHYVVKKERENFLAILISCWGHKRCLSALDDMQSAAFPRERQESIFHRLSLKPKHNKSSDISNLNDVREWVRRWTVMVVWRSRAQ